jgi:hypothetical protein
MALHPIGRIRDCIRAPSFAESLHAAKALDDDDLTLLDLESIILAGEISGSIGRAAAERQRQGSATVIYREK